MNAKSDHHWVLLQALCKTTGTTQPGWEQAVPFEACFSIAVCCAACTRGEARRGGYGQETPTLWSWPSADCLFGLGQRDTQFHLCFSAEPLSPRDTGRVKQGFQRCSGDRRGGAWHGVMGLTLLPASQKKSLTSCFNFCFPLGPSPTAQVPVTEWRAWLHGSLRSQEVGQSSAPDRVCCLRVTSFLVPASCQLERVLPRVVSDRSGFLSSAGEGCQEEVSGRAAACKAVILYCWTEKQSAASEPLSPRLRHHCGCSYWGLLPGLAPW